MKNAPFMGHFFGRVISVRTDAPRQACRGQARLLRKSRQHRSHVHAWILRDGEHP
jgi:hypothetical protein